MTRFYGSPAPRVKNAPIPHEKLDTTLTSAYAFPMEHTLKKDRLEIAVKERGAELTRLRLDGFEYLWQGDERSWTGQSPLLFPLIGGVPGDSYRMDGLSYEMPSHGIVRKRDFSLAERGEDLLRFRIGSDGETKLHFPYDFELDLIYRIKNRSLKFEYVLKNRSRDSMLFSLGAHPAFRCPLEEELSFEDYSVDFEKEETLSRRIKGEALLTGERIPFLKGERSIPLKHDLFDRGALIFDEPRSNRISLGSSRGSRSVTMDFTGFPYLGIWKKGGCGPEGSFLCMEPWHGIDSTEGDSPEWTEKEGLLKLKGDGVFRTAFTVELS